MVTCGQDGPRSPSPKIHVKSLKTHENTAKMGAPQRPTLFRRCRKCIVRKQTMKGLEQAKDQEQFPPCLPAEIISKLGSSLFTPTDISAAPSARSLIMRAAPDPVDTGHEGGGACRPFSYAVFSATAASKWLCRAQQAFQMYGLFRGGSR